MFGFENTVQFDSRQIWKRRRMDAFSVFFFDEIFLCDLYMAFEFTVDVVPRVVSFAKHTPVIQLVVGSESTPQSKERQETRGRKRKIVTEDEKERKREELIEGTNKTCSTLNCSLLEIRKDDSKRLHLIFHPFLSASSCLGLAHLGGAVLVKENEVRCGICGQTKKLPTDRSPPKLVKYFKDSKLIY